MLRNSSELFTHQCAKSKFLDTLEGVLTSQRTSPVVRDRLLDVLAAAAYASSGAFYEDLSNFGVLWRKVKPVGKPDTVSPYSMHDIHLNTGSFLQGVPLDPDDAMFNALSSRRSAEISLSCLLVRPQLCQLATPPGESNVLYDTRMLHEVEENSSLSAQRTEIFNSSLRFFECSICMDEVPMDLTSRIDPCGHIFCHECLSGYATAHTEEDSYIFIELCPTCVANKGKGKGRACGTCRVRVVPLVFHVTSP